LVCIQEWLNVHPTVDRDKFGSLGNLGLHEQIGHRIGDRYQPMAASSSPSLAYLIELANWPSLIGMKWGSVHGVNDARDFQFPSDTPA
jgi:hypothetical protein